MAHARGMGVNRVPGAPKLRLLCHNPALQDRYFSARRRAVQRGSLLELAQVDSLQLGIVGLAGGEQLVPG